MPSFHFDIGNSHPGPIGYCARIIATTKEEAVERLKAALDKLTEGGDYSLFDDCTASDTPPEPGLEYIRIYINDAAITVACIDDEEAAEHEDKDRVFHNYYRCPTDLETWQRPDDDSAHDDECPKCHAAIEPYKSDVYDSESNLLETIDWTQVQHVDTQEHDGLSEPV